MVTVPRRTYFRTSFSNSGSSIGYGSDPRTETFRYRLFTVRTSTDRVRLSPWKRASPNPVMLSSTGRASGVSLPWGNGALVLVVVGVLFGHFDVDHDQNYPDGGHGNGDPGERIAGLGPERTRPAGPAEGANQSATLPSLNQDGEDQKEPEEDDDGVERVRPKAHCQDRHGELLVFRHTRRWVGI